jgi:hypothetical protein
MAKEAYRFGVNVKDIEGVRLHSLYEVQEGVFR